LCEYAISEVDKLIEDKKNEDEIKAVLDRICYELRLEIIHDSKGGC
jgi:isochorismate synthase EntC